MRDLAAGLRALGECLFAAGAVALYPGIAGAPVLRSPADLAKIPPELPARATSLSTFHLFATCPMGEDNARCATDSFPGPTVVNPQGTVMAVAHRNALRFLEARR
jgi:hypothetical protein